MLVAVDGVDLHAAADVRDDLLGEAAVGRGKRLGLPLGSVGRLGEAHALDGVRGLVGGEQRGDLRLERDGERVLFDGCLVVPFGGRPVVERDGCPERGRRGAGDADGLRRDPVRLFRVDAMRAGEAPCAVDQDADPEALALAGGDAFDAARLDRDRLVAAADDADVGIGGAEGGRRVEGAGGEVTHDS